jgi:N-acylneuraminate cytidylyltransferase
MEEASYTESDSTTDWQVWSNYTLLDCSKGNSETIDYLVWMLTACLDGCVYYGAAGELMKKFDMRDGMGLEILRQHQVEVIVMTSKTPI